MKLIYLVRFWQDIDYPGFSALMNFAVPAGGPDYVQEKWNAMQSDPIRWLCTMTPGTLELVEIWITSEYALNIEVRKTTEVDL